MTVQYYSVRKTKFHKTIQILLLVVMSLTSSGFTTVIGYCAMSKSAVCCCDMEQNCKGTASSKSLIIKSVKSSCYSEKVAGGVNDLKAVFNTESIQKYLSFAVTIEATEYQIVDLTAQVTRFPKSPHIALYPTGVDIYIQVSSFLI
ncbi:MAG: hypothetical protein WDA22_10600 [Bacteroidota bacterium]